MKIVNKQPMETADISSARGTAFNEFWKLILSAVVLLIALFVLTGWLVDALVPRISTQTEARLFQHVRFPGVKFDAQNDSDQLEEVQAVLEKLLKPQIAPPLPYSLILVAQKMPNAFAFPGGSIGVTSGLLDELSDEIEIAFVLGHELGHFYHRDHLRGMGRAIGLSVITALVFGSSVGADTFGSMLHLVMQRRYSQEREKMADRFGLELVYAVYGRVEGTERLFKIMTEKDKIPRWAYMFATHPAPEERIRELEKYAATL